MNKEILETALEKFLSAYESKDLGTIANMVTSSVLLRDWNLETTGKDSLLDEFQKNFSNAEYLRVEILRTYTAANSIAAEVEIQVGASERLRVVDILKLDESGLITSIVSFKGL